MIFPWWRKFSVSQAAEATSTLRTPPRRVEWEIPMKISMEHRIVMFVLDNNGIIMGMHIIILSIYNHVSDVS